jgi:hypothetical protein
MQRARFTQIFGFLLVSGALIPACNGQQEHGDPEASAGAPGGAAAGAAGQSEPGLPGLGGAASASVGEGSAGEAAGAHGPGGAGGEAGSLRTDAEGGVAGAYDEPSEYDPAADGAPDLRSGLFRLGRPGGKSLSMPTLESLALAPNDDADPAQAFYLDPAAYGRVQVRNQKQGRCVNDEQGAPAVLDCEAQSELIVVRVGENKVRLEHNMLEECLSSSGDEIAFAACGEDSEWEVVPLGSNFALDATYSATSTFGGYSVDYIHDGDLNAGLAFNSWANDWNPPDVILPQTVSVDLGALHQISQIKLYTSQGYEIQDYDLDYWDGQAWQHISETRGNVAGLNVFTFAPLVTQQLRVVGIKGPEAQTIYVRINELEIY